MYLIKKIKDNKNSHESLPILNGHKKKTKKYGSIKELSRNDVPIVSYPKAVIFVLCSKFFESFAANGVRTILALYLRDSLDFTEKSATSTLHVYNFFGQFCPILGAVIADSYVGKSKSILYFFFLYAIGWIGMVAMTLPYGITVPVVPLVFLSLLFISVGNGSIRACITSLGASQFQLPEQKISLDRYFAQYYFMYTMGILLSKIVPPEIRANTQCFEKTDCYFAVFGALGMIFTASWIIFLFGLLFYRREQRNHENIMCNVVKCIWYALITKIKNYGKNIDKSKSWIEGSIGRFSESFVQDVSVSLKVIKLFLPLPIYWALLAQQDSTWTFQATQMNTNLFGYHFEPDQAKAMGPLLLLILIPIWEHIVLAIFKRFNINLSTLNSLIFGGLCAVFSFICAGALQLYIENTIIIIVTPSTSINNTTSLTDLMDYVEKPNILWQLPQFFLLMMGEILLSIPGLKFSFTQAPESMKSLITSTWFLNNAIGNLIVVCLTELEPVTTRQSTEFFIYATLMLIGIIVFIIVSVNYKQQLQVHHNQLNNMPDEELETCIIDKHDKHILSTINNEEEPLCSNCTDI